MEPDGEREGWHLLFGATFLTSSTILPLFLSKLTNSISQSEAIFALSRNAPIIPLRQVALYRFDPRNGILPA